MAPELYEEWLHYIRLEEISHQIYQILLPEKPDKETLKNLSGKLLTTKDEKNYVVQLQNMVHKVFKEEWVKTMLARGYNPDKVMEKIDEHWDNWNGMEGAIGVKTVIRVKIVIKEKTVIGIDIVTGKEAAGRIEIGLKIGNMVKTETGLKIGSMGKTETIIRIDTVAVINNRDRLDYRCSL
jgi:hypothetical protein